MSRPLMIALAALLLIGLGLGLLLARPTATLALEARRGGLELGPGAVVEVLRLKVPARQRGCWRQAEALSWEPFLRQQPGFRGRQLLWDPTLQEGVLLIGWASRADWDRIPAGELEAAQVRFEAEARRCLGLAEASTNPFPLLSSGTLLPER
jgi:uncharacterized protein (TIGR03792 family)